MRMGLRCKNTSVLRGIQLDVRVMVVRFACDASSFALLKATMDKMTFLVEKLPVRCGNLDLEDKAIKSRGAMRSGDVSFYRYFPISRRDKNWGLYITTAGEARIASHTVYRPSGHPKGFAFDWQHGRSLEGFALVYISSGQGNFEARHFSAAIEPGHAFLLFPGVWHRYA